MTSLVKLAKDPRARIMLTGRPKAGKTGALVSVINSGRYRVGVLNFDDNLDPLVAYVKPEFRDNVSIIDCIDYYRLNETAKRITVNNEPTAFRHALLSLDNWDDGEGHKWGPVNKWGNDYILFGDSLTSIGEAAKNRVLYVTNRVGSGMSDRVWMRAMQDESDMLEILTSNKANCNVIVTAHMKKLSLQIMRECKEDSDILKETKGLISQYNAKHADDMWYPSALGRALPPEILRHFPASVLATVRDGKRVLITKPQEDIDFDIGLPVVGVPEQLPQETGLLTILDAVKGTKVA